MMSYHQGECLVLPFSMQRGRTLFLFLNLREDGRIRRARKRYIVYLNTVLKWKVYDHLRVETTEMVYIAYTMFMKVKPCCFCWTLGTFLGDGRQLRNLEKAFGGDVRVCDRTALILDIFSQRAATREATLQVFWGQLCKIGSLLCGMCLPCNMWRYPMKTVFD